MKKFLWTILSIFLLGLVMHVQAQILNVPKRIGNKAVDRVNQKIDKGIDKGLDAVEDDVTGKNKKAADANADKPENVESKAPEPVPPSGKTGPDVHVEAKPDQPALMTYSKYDFVPGQTVVFFDDFSQDNVGDFPALWNTNGSGEIVTTNLFSGNWLKFSGSESIWTDELLRLPENYTIEFDLIPIKGNEGGMAGYSFRLMQSLNAKAFDHGTVPGKAGLAFFCEYFGRPGYATYINGSEGDGLGLRGDRDEKELYQKENQKYHFAFWVQKSRVRVYQNEKKLFDLPKAFPLTSVKMDRIRFEDGAAMVSNIRIAVGAPDMRNKLLTEGKLVSYGIYFDVNKDVVKPESYGTLKGIADVLKENPDLRVKIVGHTDSDGAEAANLALSKRRGASVMDALVKDFGIEASRLESDGMGKSVPIAPNDTPVNKALNRRVEFIKL